MSWSFATVNGCLAEVFFDKTTTGPIIWAHCYIQRAEYTKREQKMIDHDVRKNRLTYRNKMYYDQVGKRWLKKAKLRAFSELALSLA